jgi:hypothetical protein
LNCAQLAISVKGLYSVGWDARLLGSAAEPVVFMFVVYVTFNVLVLQLMLTWARCGNVLLGGKNAATWSQVDGSPVRGWTGRRSRDNWKVVLLSGVLMKV